MPRFITISPTHISKEKPNSWKRFEIGNYIALGWDHTDYTLLNLSEIIAHIKIQRFDNEIEAIKAHTLLYRIEVGDIVAVNNVNDGLFGIGVIKSDYKFQKHKHNNGSQTTLDYYSHYREVEWIVTDYLKRKEIVSDGEPNWEPRGTIGSMGEVPRYIIEILKSRGIKIYKTSIDWDGDAELNGYEGEAKEEIKLHKWIERNTKFVKDYKAKYSFIKNCECCQIEPMKEYGIDAISFLELHHLTPLSERKSSVNSNTRERDVVLICPNCHKLIHKLMSLTNKKMITVTQMQEYIKRKKTEVNIG